MLSISRLVHGQIEVAVFYSCIQPVEADPSIIVNGHATGIKHSTRQTVRPVIIKHSYTEFGPEKFTREVAIADKHLASYGGSRIA